MEMEQVKSKHGFASMSPEKQRMIASMGGKAAHAKGTAHKYTSDEAAAAGRKGGLKVSSNRREPQIVSKPNTESSTKPI